MHANALLRNRVGNLERTVWSGWMSRLWQVAVRERVHRKYRAGGRVGR